MTLFNKETSSEPTDDDSMKNWYQETENKDNDEIATRADTQDSKLINLYIIKSKF